MRFSYLAAAFAGLLTAGAAHAQTQVRIGYIPVLGTSQVFVAAHEGFLKEGGLEPRFIAFESGPAMISALASGTLDVYVAGVAPLAVARSKGVEVKVVASTAIEEMTVVAGAKLAPYFKAGVAPAQALKDFRAANGKPARLATQPPGSVPHTTLNHWLFEVAKADKADVEIITMGIDATQQAVLAAAVEGATLREPAVTVSIQRDPRLKIVALGGQMFPKQPGTVVAVSGGFLKTPDAVQTIVNGVVRADALIAKDPQKAATPIEAALGKGLIDKDTILKALASPATTFAVDPRAIADSTRDMQAYQVRLGTLDKEYPLEGLFDASYFDKAAAKYPSGRGK